MKLLACVLAVCTLLVSPVRADTIATEGILSARDFYRVISCGAVPGAACLKPHKRWSAEDATDITIGLAQVQSNYPTALRDIVTQAFQHAVADINAAGANVQLRWLNGASEPKIRIFLVDAAHSQVMAGTGQSFFDGQQIANARVVSNRRGNLITFAAIAMSSSLDPTDVQSIAVEETFQALGFINDIDNPEYAARTILYEGGNVLEALSELDIQALRTKYAY